MSKRKVPNSKLLKELYLNKKMHSRQIAKEYGCTYANVCKQLKKLGITRKQKGETHSQWKGGRGNEVESDISLPLQPIL